MTVVNDNYTGHVEPGTAARRILPGATIIKASVGPMDNNAYLVTCSETGETLLIDAANDADDLVDLVRKNAPKLALIVTSHQHFDHWQALEAVVDATGAPTRRARDRRRPAAREARPATGRGDTDQVGKLTFDVIHLRGHTPGSVALALSGPAAGDATQLFTGDCLFPGGLGRTTKPAEFDSLFRDVTSGCSTSTRTRRSSIPATVTTPRWVPSVRISKSGASDGGDGQPGVKLSLA